MHTGFDHASTVRKSPLHVCFAAQIPQPISIRCSVHACANSTGSLLVDCQTCIGTTILRNAKAIAGRVHSKVDNPPHLVCGAFATKVWTVSL